MTWLVTGGAGYIGAHIARCLKESGRSVAVLDDLSTGVRNFVDPGTRFHEGSILDADVLRTALTETDGTPITGVIHCAGFKYAGESVKRPLHTYTQNVQGTQHLLEVMAEAGVKNIVFSSSAGVYGTPDTELVTETTATTPESPYGESKLIGEWLLRNVGRVSDLTHTSLRYFNVVGSGHPDIYDVSPHNLFPVVLKTLTEAESRRSVAPTTPPPTVPACATTCTCRTSRWPTSRPPPGWRPGSPSSGSTTWAAAAAPRFSRS